METSSFQLYHEGKVKKRRVERCPNEAYYIVKREGGKTKSGAGKENFD